MMRLIIPLVLLLAGVGGGIGAGFVLGGAEETPADAEEETVDEPAADEDEEESAEDEGDPPRVQPTDNDTEYVRLNNQFVVPVVRNGSVRSLVVLGLAVEVGSGQSSEVFNRELRLRDSFLRALFAHANAGGFDGRFTEDSALAPLREALLEAAIQILGPEITHEVLVTDINRQDA